MAPKIRNLIILVVVFILILLALYVFISAVTLIEKRNVEIEKALELIPTASYPSETAIQTPLATPQITTESNESELPVIVDLAYWESARYAIPEDGSPNIDHVMIYLDVESSTAISFPSDGAVRKTVWGDEDEGAYEESIEFLSRDGRINIIVTSVKIVTIYGLEGSAEYNEPGEWILTESGEVVGLTVYEELVSYEGTHSNCGNMLIEIPKEENNPEKDPLDFINEYIAGRES
ncbi:MAG: hypothetical protein PHP35_00095 [Candidatus Colwellbacteria bacterium]|nr:hypothetical protein [Candidatus Colwellbacteria bacterium]